MALITARKSEGSRKATADRVEKGQTSVFRMRRATLTFEEWDQVDQATVFGIAGPLGNDYCVILLRGIDTSICVDGNDL